MSADCGCGGNRPLYSFMASRLIDSHFAEIARADFISLGLKPKKRDNKKMKQKIRKK